ncbi:hypothetical protein [Streptomyces siamensis]|uniref:hypothetical protein n=1 Tax=Streptomyces siamensis TaxID=1274986 RepID=UPI0031E5560E
MHNLPRAGQETWQPVRLPRLQDRYGQTSVALEVEFQARDFRATLGQLADRPQYVPFPLPFTRSQVASTSEMNRCMSIDVRIAHERHELLGMPTTEASVNITRSRLGRRTRQGFLTQPGRGRYQKRT